MYVASRNNGTLYLPNECPLASVSTVLTQKVGKKFVASFRKCKHKIALTAGFVEYCCFLTKEQDTSPVDAVEER